MWPPLGRLLLLVWYYHVLWVCYLNHVVAFLDLDIDSLYSDYHQHLKIDTMIVTLQNQTGYDHLIEHDTRAHQTNNHWATTFHYKPLADQLPSHIQQACQEKRANESLGTGGMEDFVHDNETKTVLYIFSHDEASVKRAIQQSICYDWMFPMPLRVSMYMENQVYKYYFQYFRAYWKREGIKYIITTTYKYMDNPTRKEFTLPYYYEQLQKVHENQFDFLPLWPSNGTNWIDFAARCHGKNFSLAWDGLLSAMGYDEEQRKAAYKHPPFYKNSYIATVELLNGLVDFMIYATNVMENNATVTSLMERDGHYLEWGTMTPQQLQLAFHANYYKMYPFVMERLPIFYIYHHRFKVCDYLHPLCGTSVFSRTDKIQRTQKDKKDKKNKPLRSSSSSSSSKTDNNRGKTKEKALQPS